MKNSKNFKLGKYEFRLTSQGEKMDGEKLFGLVVMNKQCKEDGIPEWMGTVAYDELTSSEIMHMFDLDINKQEVIV